MLGRRALRNGRSTRGALVFSVAAGVAYGLATLTTRQVGRTFVADEPWALLGTPTPYVLAGCSLVAIAVLQRALQTSPLLAFPVTSGFSALVPVCVGVATLGDAVPGGIRSAGFGVALALLCAGLVLLSADRSAAEGRVAAAGGGDSTRGSASN
jgi:FtsH-binding integral membrane protein